MECTNYIGVKLVRKMSPEAVSLIVLVGNEMSITGR